MIATESYIDENGQVIIDGQPLQFVRRPQNLKAAPSRHRKQPEQLDQKAYIRSFADAAASILVLMAAITAMGVLLAIIKY